MWFSLTKVPEIQYYKAHTEKKREKLIEIEINVIQVIFEGNTGFDQVVKKRDQCGICQGKTNGQKKHNQHRYRSEFESFKKRQYPFF